eukprot:comp5474_c0_seq1/m.4744 comp5474_c0_seq1/g.4744  ORF comp5474_c0_seq1/g.4744 comp5474_c0_seq1/m.4744 type:complete len:198 (-) comp5474_c0_seq1:54-647(-)
MSSSWFALDKFALRQFQPGYVGSFIPMNPQEFMQKLLALNLSQDQLKPGYAPFCKHVFVPNFTDATSSVLPITDENRALLVSAYQARTPKELPVLNRWFPRDKMPPNTQPAKYLDLILYSREQCEKESEAMKDAEPISPEPWRIISIKTQNEDFETPMNPITMMRNALISEGGSGVPIDREQYMAAVKYWENHAVLS